jgi:hypothetical protein
MDAAALAADQGSGAASRVGLADLGLAPRQEGRRGGHPREPSFVRGSFRRGHLVDAAARGDIAAAKALIPWLNQALGMPQERVQHTTPSTLEELERMDTAALEELVRKGRERRLSRAGSPGGGCASLTGELRAVD